jgi:hypothetical protein
VASLSVAALLLLAACSAPTVKTSATAAATAATATHTPLATSTPAPTPVAITNLGAFRSALGSAFTGGKWEQIVPLLSPAFTFQATNVGGTRIVMPQSLEQFKQAYAGGGGWSVPDGSWDDPAQVLWCDSGSTPANQLMGYLGHDGSWVLLGLGRWQGYWVLAWAYQDPIGATGECL